MEFPKALANRSSSRGPTVLTAICSAIVALCAFVASVSAGPANEYQVKAAFLFNFAKFVEWPPNAFSDTNTPFVIGVLGQDPFGSYLDDIVRGERVNNRSLTVQRYRHVGEIKQCQVLFISRSESDHIDQIVSSLKYRKILLVTDADGGNGGVTIRFVNEGNRIRFKIDVQAAKAANLVISSKLLRLG
ncbi:MAG TPA: YfiR family protein [Pyrinomonadaceae bacterium]|nr:YfiR family protein [Pyrinomonadaceae bacterium]